MTRKISFLFLILALTFGFTVGGFAQKIKIDNYQGKKFPSNNVIKKTANGLQLFKNSKLSFLRVAGKHLNSDGSYSVYIYVKNKAGAEKFLAQPLIIRRLDTNLWIVSISKSQATLMLK